ncbi:MAG: hypothetical protein ACNA8W_10415, partial [Bradymonadaceae bacterium]
TIPSPGTVGADRIFEVSLLAGERLAAVLDTSNSQAFMYVLGACGDGQSCLVNSGRGEDLFVNYTAAQDEVVYLVVDRTSSFSASDTFELGVIIQPPGCDDGPRACYGGRILGSCTNGEDYELYLCDGACTGDTCETPRGDVCHDAIILTSGEEATGNWTGSDAVNPGSGIVGACSFGAAHGQGRDTIYAIDLQPNEVLEVELTTTMSTAMLYILGDCARESETCLANLTGSGGRLFYQSESEERVYIVVDRTSSFSTTTSYKVKTTIHTPHCVPGARECGEGSALDVCNDFGVWEDHECENGCADGACIDPGGDSCYEAIQVTTPAILTGATPAVVTGNWTGTDRVNPGLGEIGGCDFGDFDPRGVDTVYAVSVGAGQVLRADLQTTNTSAMFYIMEDCTRADSCVANSPSFGPGTLYYESDVSQTLYVVVDYRYTWTSTVSFSLDLSVQDGGCATGTTRCSADGETLEVCNSLGVFDFYACDGTCTAGSCDDPGGDICADVVVVVSGDKVDGDWTGTNTMEPGGGQVGACGFGVRTGEGRDTFYGIDLEAGDVLDARLTTNNGNAMLYLVEDCRDPASCLAYVRPSGAPRLFYEATEAGRVYLVVDSSSSFSSSVRYDLEVDIKYPECIPGQQACADDLKTMRLCNSFGIYEDYPCDGDCLGSSCETPAGDSCTDAIPLLPGDEFVGSLGSFTNTLNPGPATCFHGQTVDELAGRDAVFAIFLDQGDILTADVVPSSNTLSLYILEDCHRSAAEACVHAQVDTRRLSFYAPESKTYYLVVDLLSSWATPSFTLRTHVQPGGVCQPGGSTCEDASSALSICNAEGSQFVAFTTCAHGCDRDQCAGPSEPNTNCSTVETIWESTRLRDHIGRFTDEFNPGVDSCTGVSTLGRDAVYRVSMAGGQVLRATVKPDNRTHDIVVYLAGDCDSVAATCLDAARSREGEFTAGYHALQAEDVFVFVDTENANSSGYFSLDIEVGQAECDSDTGSYCGGSVWMQCDRLGQYQPEECAFGCGFEGCLPPPNDHCEDALDATDGVGFRGEISAYTALYSPSSSECTGSGGAGPEAVFFVDALPFEVIRVVYQSDTYDGAIWITRDCADAEDSCIASVNTSAPGQIETLDHIVTEAGRYYIMADSSSTAAHGDFQVDIWVDQPFCASDEVTCLDANTLGVCAPERNVFLSYACGGGCSDNQCLIPRGDICQDVIDADGGGTFSGDFATLTDQVSPPFGGCTGFDAPGPEAMYSVELQAGQTLTATLSNVDESVDLSLYLTGSCLEAATTCLTGSDVYGAAAETITYTATSDETVFIVADSYTENATGKFELDVLVQ